MTLDQAKAGVPLKVAGFHGLDEADRARLAGLGLRPGAPVTKIMPLPLRDPVECLVGSQLLALEARLLAKIRVEAE
jgi:Fe2+ transport system protein FeoA